MAAERGRRVAEDVHGSEVGADVEGMAPDANHAVGDGDGDDVTVSIECIFKDRSCAVGYNNVSPVISSSTDEDMTKIGDGIGIFGGAIPFSIVEGIAADASHAVAAANGSELGKTIKSIFADVGDVVADADGCNIASIVLPRLGVRIVVAC